MDSAQRQKWPDLLAIVRHGQSERNVAKEQAKALGAATVWGGTLRDVDTPLTALGVQQAIQTGKFLHDLANFDIIFSSPYMRALQTSQHITGQLDPAPPIIMEERVREIEFGVLDGLTHHGIKERFPDEWARREREGKYWYRPPGGESRPDVALRVHSFLGALTRDFRQKKCWWSATAWWCSSSAVCWNAGMKRNIWQWTRKMMFSIAGLQHIDMMQRSTAFGWMVITASATSSQWNKHKRS